LCPSTRIFVAAGTGKYKTADGRKFLRHYDRGTLQKEDEIHTQDSDSSDDDETFLKKIKKTM